MATKAGINQIYQDILGRDADAGGLEHFLSTGDDLEKIRNDIAISTEAKGKVQDLYTDLFGSNRVADFAGNDQNASWWTGEEGLGANEAGKGTLAAVKENIMKSQEYKDLDAFRKENKLGDYQLDKNPTADLDAFRKENKLGDYQLDKNPTADYDPNDDDDLTNAAVVAKNDTKEKINDAVAEVETVDTSNVIDHDSTSGINQIDTDQILADIQEAQGDIHSLQGQFSGLGGIDPDQVQSVVDSTYGQQLKDLDSTYSKDIGDLQTQLGDLSTKTTQQRVDLEKSLGDASSMFSSRLDNMQTTWNKSLKDQQSSFGDTIAKQGSDFDQKLKNISANMDYRMLDDNAAGVKMRRSKAFKQGKTSRGTSQLGRSMRIKSLNI